MAKENFAVVSTDFLHTQKQKYHTVYFLFEN